MTKFLTYSLLLSLFVNYYFISLKDKIDNNQKIQKFLRVFEDDSTKATFIIKDSIDLLATHVTLASPVKTLKITSGFGNRIHPVTKKNAFHNGVDIYGLENENIFASDFGYVTDVFFNDIGGKQVIIKYDNNIVCGYAHLKDVLVKEGDIIKKNAVIGKIGNTGRCTGTHLHFTIKNKDDVFVNPMTFLKSDTITTS